MSATSAGFLHRGEAAGKCRVVRFALLRVAIRACACDRCPGTSTDIQVRGLSCSARQVEGLKGTLPRNSSARLSRSRAAQRSDPGHLPQACLRSQTPGDPVHRLDTRSDGSGTFTTRRLGADRAEHSGPERPVIRQRADPPQCRRQAKTHRMGASEADPFPVRYHRSTRRVDTRLGCGQIVHHDRNLMKPDDAVLAGA